MKHLLFAWMLLAGSVLLAQKASWSNSFCQVTYDTGTWLALSDEPSSLILTPVNSLVSGTDGTKILVISSESLPPDVSSLGDYVSMLKSDLAGDENTKIESEEDRQINGQPFKMLRMNMLDEETSERIVIQMAITLHGQQVVAFAYGTEAVYFSAEWPSAEQILNQIKWL